MPSSVRCPECGARVHLLDAEPGDRVTCDRCDMRFRVGDEEADPPPIARGRSRRDGDEDDDDRPRRSRRSVEKSGASKRTWILGGIAVGAMMLVFGGLIGLAVYAVREPDPPSGVTLAQARAGFATVLTPHPRQDLDEPFEPDGPAPQPPREIYQLVRYNSPAGPLAAYVTPDRRDGKRRPAIIYGHGGFGGIAEEAWDEDDTEPFRKAGFVVCWPSWRAECDNPGRFELFYGEVDDAVAAVNYVSALPYVDPNRVYMAGHSTGGTVTLLTALSTPKLRAAFSMGGAPDIENVVGDGSGYGNTPFNYRDKKECRLRSAVDYVSTLKVPTFYFEGSDEGYCRDAARMERIAKKHGAPFRAFEVRGGDHFTIVQPMTELMAKKIAADTGPTCNIQITDSEVQAAYRAAGGR